MRIVRAHASVTALMEIINQNSFPKCHAKPLPNTVKPKKETTMAKEKKKKKLKKEKTKKKIKKKAKGKGKGTKKAKRKKSKGKK